MADQRQMQITKLRMRVERAERIETRSNPVVKTGHTFHHDSTKCE